MSSSRGCSSVGGSSPSMSKPRARIQHRGREEGRNVSNILADPDTDHDLCGDKANQNCGSPCLPLL